MYCVCGTIVVIGRGTQTRVQWPRSTVIGRQVVTGTGIGWHCTIGAGRQGSVYGWWQGSTQGLCIVGIGAGIIIGACRGATIGPCIASAVAQGAHGSNSRGKSGW